MKRYELVEEYPNSLKAGSIVEWDEVRLQYKSLNDNRIFTKEYIEGWPRFWKDVARRKRTPSEKLKAFLDSPKGKESIKRMGEKFEKERRQGERDYARFVRMVEFTGLEQLMDKIVTKYESKEYDEKELRAGYYEPRETLKDVIYRYFEEHGEPTEEGSNEFMVGNFRIGSYVVGLMIGQGSYIKIQKL